MRRNPGCALLGQSRFDGERVLERSDSAAHGATMTLITVTMGRRKRGVVNFYDAPVTWAMLELAFPQARSITLSNSGWSVDLGLL
jgi:hypothetical protein